MGVESVSNIGPSISYVRQGQRDLQGVLTKSGITFQNEVDMLKAGQGDGHGDGRLWRLTRKTVVTWLLKEAKARSCSVFTPAPPKGGLKGYDSGRDHRRDGEARTEEA